MSNNTYERQGFMKRMATVIVDKRNLIIVIYVFAIIFCLFSMGWVYVENDITKYLPEDTETRQGLVAMNDNFASFGTARIMVSNVTLETAQQIYETISAVDGVMMVTFDDTAEHYKDACALFDVNFAGAAMAGETVASMETIRSLLSGYDLHVDTLVGYDENAMLRDEMMAILVVAVVIILVVLTLTSRSYMEVPVLLLTFGVAALLNMGTNFIFGTISFISDSIAVVLQLALSIDYAIILCHRFSDEHETKGPREACIDALAKAIPEISASSMTTIGGLAALGFMKFSIGFDMAMVLIKAIFLSLISVFTLMPGLLMLFCPIIDKTRHKKLLPNMDWMGKFAVKTRRVLPVLFIICLGAAFWLSGNCPYCYSYNDLRTAKMAERQHAYFDIKETFGASNMVALLVPSGDYEAESKILQELNQYPEVKSTMGLSGIEAIEGHTLTDALKPRELAEMVGLDYEVAQLLYTAYAVDQNQLGKIINGIDEYAVPLFDMFLYLKEQMDTHNISVGGEDQAMIEDMLSQLVMAKEQMKTDSYTRMVVYLALPEESEETFAFLQEIRDVVGQYYADDYYVLGNSTSSRDLSASFASDNLLISLLSAFFVILTLLFTFQSVGMSVLLIMVIQGSIWINFSIPTLTNQPIYFLGYLTVNAIMMGANIDYAIVISSHYQALKEEMHHKEAIVHAMNEAFPTVFTSGTIMAAAGLLIGNMSAQPVVSIMGSFIGKGTFISIGLVLLVLPSILVLGDSIIERTAFKVKGLEMPVRDASGTMHVHGHLRGYVSGMVDGEFSGTIRGDMQAMISAGSNLSLEEKEIWEGGDRNA